MPVDYSKWDAVDDEDDEMAAPRQLTPERKAHHDQSMVLIAAWVREADPRLSPDETLLLMGFLAVQHHGIHPDNVRRHVEIVAFLERAAVQGKEPSVHALLALGQLCKDRSQDADAEAAARANRVLGVAVGALNTLWAARCEGGARQLFDALLHEPTGALAKRYRDSEFAFDCVAAPPEDPRDAPPPAEPVTWLRQTGSAVLLQLGAAIFSLLVTWLTFGLTGMASSGGASETSVPATGVQPWPEVPDSTTPSASAAEVGSD